jgi:hypothetical protein
MNLIELKVPVGGIEKMAQRLNERDAKGIALYAIRFSREEVQRIVGVSSEVLRDSLMQFIKWDQWFQLERFILRSFRTVRKLEMDELQTRMLESQHDPNLLRSLSVECRERSQQQRKELFRRRDLILKVNWPPKERGKNRPKPIPNVT